MLTVPVVKVLLPTDWLSVNRAEPKLINPAVMPTAKAAKRKRRNMMVSPFRDKKLDRANSQRSFKAIIAAGPAVPPDCGELQLPMTITIGELTGAVCGEVSRLGAPTGASAMGFISHS